MALVNCPECNQEVAKQSDFIGSTKEIMEYVVKSDKKQFVIAGKRAAKNPYFSMLCRLDFLI